MSKFRDYLNEEQWENDPTQTYDELGKLAEEIREYYFTAMDSLDRLKLGYGEDEENLRQYARDVKENVDKILIKYLNTENYNQKDWAVVNKPWK